MMTFIDLNWIRNCAGNVLHTGVRDVASENGSLHQYKFRTILFIGFFDPAKLLDVKVSSWAVPFYINLESSLKEYPTYIT